MDLAFFKYQGAGNDFIIIDNRETDIQLTEKQIRQMCDRRFGIGADGFMEILKSDNTDFKMKYYNSDGREGSMCGNGGRCIAKAAWHLGICGENMRFNAFDGAHSARIFGDEVALQMQRTAIPESLSDVIDTGSPHIIVPVTHLDDYAVTSEGRRLRFDHTYAPEGTNVNFIEQLAADDVRQRTYERGVEAETLACGTGAVAVAVYQAVKHKLKQADIHVHMPGGELRISLVRSGDFFTNIWMTGQGEKVFKGTYHLD